MQIAFVMDPVDKVNIHADTTFAFMLAAQARGHQVFYVRPEDLMARGDEAWATLYPCSVRRVAGNHVTLGAPVQRALHTLDALWMRKDPPFDVAYLYEVALLELAEEKGCLVINKPRGLRDANEKLYALHFAPVIPETIVTGDAHRIKDFVREHGDRAVLKPLGGHGGSGIFVAETGDRNLNAMIEVSTDHGRRPIMCQAYLPEARHGDKRIIMLNGQPLGAILRVPMDEEHRSNLHVGGSAVQTTLTERDRQICELVGPRLVADGLWFVGLDVIGGRLTEVNVTSPTGIQEMSRLDGMDGPDRVMAWMEDHARQH